MSNNITTTPDANLSEKSDADEAAQNPATAGAAVTLDYCLIEAVAFPEHQNATARLFVNGRQESELLISLRGLDSQGVVTSLPRDIKIELVPVGPINEGFRVTTARSPADWSAFDETTPGLLPATYAEKPSGAAVAQDYFTRYVIYDSVRRDSSIKFIVKVTLSNGVVFTTDATDVAYGGTGEHGRFNSSVSIKAVAPLFYQGNALRVEAQSPIERVINAGGESRTARIVDHIISLFHPASSTKPILARLLSGSTPTAESSCHYNKATANAFAGTVKKNLPTGTMGALLNQALDESPSTRPHVFCVRVAAVAYNAGMFNGPRESHLLNGCDEYGNAIKLKTTLESTNPVDTNNPWIYTVIIESMAVLAQNVADAEPAVNSSEK